MSPEIATYNFADMTRSHAVLPCERSVRCLSFGMFASHIKNVLLRHFAHIMTDASLPLFRMRPSSVPISASRAFRLRISPVLTILFRRRATFVNTISRVIDDCARPQVLWVATAGSVARMTGKIARLYGPMRENISDAITSVLFIRQAKRTISTLEQPTTPHPAIINASDVNIRPEPLSIFVRNLWNWFVCLLFLCYSLLSHFNLRDRLSWSEPFIPVLGRRMARFISIKPTLIPNALQGEF